MKYTRTYNHSNGREFANVTFEDGSKVSYEISTSRYNGVTLRQCGGRVPCGMRMVFVKNNIEFEEIENPFAGQFMEIEGWGKGEIVSKSANVAKLQNVETGIVKAFNI
jgi:hypothetical protein